jgi:L-fuculose-phosphate aldolase
MLSPNFFELCNQGVIDVSIESLTSELSFIAKLTYDRGLVFGVGGNISVRSNDKVLITPEGARFRNINPDEIIVSDESGKIVGAGRPSIEFPMHIAIYQGYPEVKAVIHTHSPYATIWSSAGNALISKTVEGRFVLGEIPVASYAEPGTPKLAEAVVEKLRGKKAVLLQNHGVVAVGSSLNEVFDLAETIEETAKIEILGSVLTHRLK